MNENNKSILIDTSSKANPDYLVWKKNQTNDLSSHDNSTSYYTISCVNGQIIRYNLNIWIPAIATTTIYNIKLKDPLNPYLSFIPGTFYGNFSSSSFQKSLYGTVKFNPTTSTVVDGKTLGGTIEWNIPCLSRQFSSFPYSVNLYYDCEVVYNLS